MSVYKRSYGSYTGPRTPHSSRLAVLMRYGFADVWSSNQHDPVHRVFCATSHFSGHHLPHEQPGGAALLVGDNLRLIAIDQRLFLLALQIQCWLALVLTAWIGPRLMSPDLADNALPIILSHPISRLEYVAGKLAVLVGFLSAVTWMPLLLLFVFQSYSSPKPWAGEHLFIAFGVLAGALIWIAFLSLYTLALSSWVKWRIVATGLIFAAVFVPAGIGAIFNGVMRTNWGTLLNLPRSMSTMWEWLLRVEPSRFETVRAGTNSGYCRNASDRIGRLRSGAQCPHSCARGGARMNDRIIFDDVSKFYGEVLGVNRVTLSLASGITALVGPNGSGKTTLDEPHDRPDSSDARSHPRSGHDRR